MSNKKIYVFASVLLLMSFGVGLIHFISKKEALDILVLKNIEAIAADETDSEGRITCYASFIGKGQGSKTVKDCGDCMDTDCIDCSDKGKCKK